MKRVNTWQDVAATGRASIDLGDGIVLPIPTDAAGLADVATAKTEAIADATTKYGGLPARVTAAEANAWQRPVDNVLTTLDDYTTPGVRQVTKSGVVNRPIGASGRLEVIAVGSLLVQEWTTTETEPRQFIRSRNGSGVWSGWISATWRGANVLGSDDLNNLVLAGYYKVSNGTTLNKPTAGVGVVEVIPVDGSNIIQRFTTLETVNRVFHRQRTGGTWTDWGQAPTGADLAALTSRIDSLPTGGESSFAPERAEVGTWTPTAAPVGQANAVTELSRDRLTGWNGNSGGLLQQTKDLGATWTPVHTFPGPLSWTRELANGELLCSVGVGTDARKIWVSTGYPELGAACTWSNTLTAANPGITFSADYGFHMHENIVLVNEYGNKYTGVGSTTPEGQNARYTYMSTDYGKTWATIFDLNTWVVARGKPDTQGVHPHGVAWDPYWDRIWYTYGDDVNGYAYSDDMGATWHNAYHGSAANSPYQVVGILPMPKCVLFGTDTAPNGVMRISRTQGKRTGTYPIEQAYTVPGDDGTTRTHLCHVLYRVRREGGDGPAILGFSSESTAAPSFIVTTPDGYDYTLLWMDSQAQAPGKGLRNVVGPTMTGELLALSDDQRTANNWTVWRGPVPIY